jgi:hypothetical protein
MDKSNWFPLAVAQISKNLINKDKALVEGLAEAFKEIIEKAVVPLTKLAELWDPYSLVHEDFFVSKSGLYMANLISLDDSLIKPATMSDSWVFICLGDNGGYSQALLRAYQSIGGAKGIVLREKGIDQLDLPAMKKRLEVEDLEDVIFDVKDLEDENLENLTNDLQGLQLQAIKGLKENVEEEAENGAALVVAQKEIEFKDLWNQEIEFKPYFLYYAIVGLTCLERNGSMVIRIYDTNTEFTKTLIYLLAANFTSMAIVQPHSVNGFTSERFLVLHRMIHKDVKSNEVIDNLKSVFTNLKEMHLKKTNDIETLLLESELKEKGLSLKSKIAV